MDRIDDGQKFTQAQYSKSVCKANDAILLGFFKKEHPENSHTDCSSHTEQKLRTLRNSLGSYVKIRPIRTYKELLDKSDNTSAQDTNISIYQEIKGCIHIELSKPQKTKLGIYNYSHSDVLRIMHLAFISAQSRRSMVTLINKAPLSENSILWRKMAIHVAELYPHVKLKFLMVDDALIKFKHNPRQFDVILTENRVGDYIANQANNSIEINSGLQASASIGKQCALFEPLYEVFTNNKAIANPIASILSAAMLLDYFHLCREAKVVRSAVEKSIALKVSTPDMNPLKSYTTVEVGNFIKNLILQNKTIVDYREVTFKKGSKLKTNKIL
ncbi:MAG: 3-isopropylmalate dehydrogenase [Flavobacteriaceae bacterium]|nr:3-isopropylmalate dehydrogenase [Flavobacteriaceae bacterium]